MKQIPLIRTGLLFIALIFANAVSAQIDRSGYASELQHKLLKKDSLLFNAIFNTCDTKEIENILSKDFVFFQDRGITNPTTNQSHDEFIASIKKNFCDNKAVKMRRGIVEGTVHVFSKGKDEAIQTGVQHFYMVQDKKEKLVEESKFSRVWKKSDGDWRISSELDFLINTKFNNSPTGSNSLYNEIAHMDSILFNAYNAHTINEMLDFFTKDLEFYHDTGGLISYNNVRDNSEQLFAQNNKIRRDLIAGSLEVYPIKNYGAIEIGSHRFCHDENGKQDCGTFKFVHVWKKENGEWKISRVVSYDH